MEYLESVNGFKNFEVIKREEHLGCSKNIVEGITEILEKHDSVIVLEDDLITSPYFLTFMNEALNEYKNNENVISICGYTYPIKKLPEIFFIKHTNILGWATWSDRWQLFENNPKKILLKLKNMPIDDLLEVCKFENQLKKTIINKKFEDWDIKWYFTAYINNKLTLYPGKNLVKHIGYNRDSMTHSINMMKILYNTQLYNGPIIFKKIQPVENCAVKKKITMYYRKTMGLRFMLNFLVKFRKIFI